MSLHPPNLPRGEAFPPSPSYSNHNLVVPMLDVHAYIFPPLCCSSFRVWAQAGPKVNVPRLIHVRAEMKMGVELIEGVHAPHRISPSNSDRSRIANRAELGMEDISGKFEIANTIRRKRAELLSLQGMQVSSRPTAIGCTETTRLGLCPNSTEKTQDSESVRIVHVCFVRSPRLPSLIKLI